MILLCLILALFMGACKTPKLPDHQRGGTATQTMPPLPDRPAPAQPPPSTSEPATAPATIHQTLAQPENPDSPSRQWAREVSRVYATAPTDLTDPPDPSDRTNPVLLSETIREMETELGGSQRFDKIMKVAGDYLRAATRDKQKASELGMALLLSLIGAFCMLRKKEDRWPTPALIAFGGVLGVLIWGWWIGPIALTGIGLVFYAHNSGVLGGILSKMK